MAFRALEVPFKLRDGKIKLLKTFIGFMLNIRQAPLIADLFLLAILAIGKEEVKGGTLGTGNILPIDIMVFFLTPGLHRDLDRRLWIDQISGFQSALVGR